jgi:uncharacterized protein (DUF924 family)
MTETFDPQTVLDFWFPDDGHWESLETHLAFWEYRMRGGVDDAILRDFGPITEAAAQGELDHWADTPRGRLALLIALDQFPRSYWRGTPAAYAQDIKANLLVLGVWRTAITRLCPRHGNGSSTSSRWGIAKGPITSRGWTCR